MLGQTGPVRRIGLTGGIGAGKSVVAARLAELGAIVVDADQLARDVVRPGQPALAEVVARFGAQVLDPSGGLDRAGLARIVFADPDALAALNAIMHPRIAQAAAGRMRRAAEEGAAVVVYDMPLLVENGLAGEYDAVVVVTAQPQVRLGRLVGRGMSRTDAIARMANQASERQRLAVADHVIDNSGPLPATLEQVDRLWPVLAGAQPLSQPGPTVGP